MPKKRSRMERKSKRAISRESKHTFARPNRMLHKLPKKSLMLLFARIDIPLGMIFKRQDVYQHLDGHIPTRRADKSLSQRELNNNVVERSAYMCIHISSAFSLGIDIVHDLRFNMQHDLLE